ncbi:MAG: type II toxin-antitoxin system HipA family toxin [Pseudomonadota bacterium]
MASQPLIVLLNDTIIGEINQLRSGKLSFSYAETWINDRSAIPLSLSMPLTRQKHGDDAIRPFLWGLLSDNETTLAAWGQRFGVSPRNPFALLAHIGEDLQGAIQIVPPGQLEHLRKREGATRLSASTLAQGFAALIRQPGSTQFTEQGGQFSLAGAQPKKALSLVRGRWYEPRGRTPSTHILKPQIPNMAGQVENEAFCLRLAPMLDLPAPKAWIEQFGELPVIVIQRYDRVRMEGRRTLPIDRSGGQVRRVHQEDCCQALKVMPQTKYQNEGGPGIANIMQLLSGSARPSDDRDRFMRAQAFNFVIGGTDAHAKNYGLLLATQGRFRLAPLYDIISILPYLNHPKESRLAMSVDGRYRLDQIQPRHWQKQARVAGYNADQMLAHLRDIIARMPSAVETLLDEFHTASQRTEELETLAQLLIARSQSLASVYGSEETAAKPK